MLSRRALLAGAGPLLAALSLPAVARAGGRKILLIGGSTMAGGMGKYLEDELGAAGHGVKRRARAASGLARPDFFDWPAEATRLQASVQPDATVVMFGGNDGQGLFMGENAQPSWIKWEEPSWAVEYARRVTALADAVAPGGEHVFWVGMPAVRLTSLNRRIHKMNGICESEMGKRENAHFLDLVAVLSNGTGAYTDLVAVGGKKIKARADDGIHLTMQGAKVAVQHLVPQILERVAVS